MKTDQEIVEEMRQKYGYVAPTREIVMDVISIKRKEILWSVEDRIVWHRTECRFSKNCSTCEVLFYIKKQIEEEK